MNFRKSADPKIYVADFWNFKQGFLIMKLTQNSNFRVQGMFFNNCIEKNQNKTHGCSTHNSKRDGSRRREGGGGVGGSICLKYQVSSNFKKEWESNSTQPLEIGEGYAHCSSSSGQIGLRLDT